MPAASPSLMSCSPATESPRRPTRHMCDEIFFDVHAATGSFLAKEAPDRIGQLYRVEETIYGVLPDDRRRERQRRSMPIAAALQAWGRRSRENCRANPNWPPPSICARA